MRFPAISENALILGYQYRTKRLS